MPLANVIETGEITFCPVKKAIELQPRIFDAAQKRCERSPALYGDVADNKLINADVLGHQNTANLALTRINERLLNTSGDISWKKQGQHQDMASGVFPTNRQLLWIPPRRQPALRVALVSFQR